MRLHNFQSELSLLSLFLRRSVFRRREIKPAVVVQVFLCAGCKRDLNSRSLKRREHLLVKLVFAPK